MEDYADYEGAKGEVEEGGIVQSLPAQELWRLEPGPDELGV